jgi:zinc and cadmium transporter
MNIIRVYILVSTLVVSLISLTGIAFILVNRKILGRIIHYLVSFAVGGLFGGAFFHLIPESFENFKKSSSASLLIITGILLFFILEKFLHWMHDHEKSFSSTPVKVQGPLNIVADAFHNFIDGILIAASFIIDRELGMATTIAVLLHEIPQEIGDFGVLIHSGYTVTRALFYNFLSALTAFIGVFTVFAMGSSAQVVAHYVIPLAAGGFIYLAGSDLIPELHNENSFRKSVFQLLTMLLGFAILFLLTFLEK